tara:strand:- start:224 stop:499 length:276 start_codon:yes stop_codon:yes gene_type:complete
MARQKEQVMNLDEFTEYFGGPNKLYRALGLAGPSTIHKWRNGGNITAVHAAQLIALAESKRVRLEIPAIQKLVDMVYKNLKAGVGSTKLPE